MTEHEDMTELEEIKKFWRYKYPHIDVMLWTNAEGNRYYGKMQATECSQDLDAETIGNLISQGESFLRKQR